MIKMPLLPKTHKKLQLESKGDISLNNKMVLPDLPIEEMQKQKIKETLKISEIVPQFNSMFHPKSLYKPVKPPTAQHKRRVLSLNKNQPSPANNNQLLEKQSQKYFQGQRIRKQILKYLSLFPSLYQTSPQIQQIRQNIRKILHQQTVQELALNKKKRAIFMKKALSMPNYQRNAHKFSRFTLNKAFNIYVKPPIRIGTSRKQIKLNSNLESLSKKIQEKQIILNKLQSNIQSIKTINDKQTERYEYMQAETKKIQKRLQFYEEKQSMLHDQHKSSSLQCLLKAICSCNAIKHKIYKLRRPHTFKNMHFQLQSVPYINEQVFNELKELISCYPTHHSEESKDVFIGNVTSYAHRIIDAYQFIISQFNSANEQRQLYVRNIELILQEFGQAQQFKRSLQRKLKMEFIQISRKVSAIFQKLQSLSPHKPTSQKQNICTSIQQIKREEKYSKKMRKGSMKILNESHSKKVKFNEQDSIFARLDQQFERKESRIKEHINMKMEDLHSLKQYNEQVEQMYLAIISLD